MSACLDISCKGSPQRGQDVQIQDLPAHLEARAVSNEPILPKQTLRMNAHMSWHYYIHV
jgi:hypothetical protein